MFSIKTVCAATGVNPVTLRAWERRYGLLQPQRTPTGHRLYSDADVERIRRVLALTHEGVSIGQVKDALDSQPVAAAPTSDAGPWPGLHRRLAAAVAAFDEPGLEAIYAEALALHPVDVVDRMLLMPLLKQLGERWGQVAGGVAEEHFFLAYVRHKIGARFHHRRVLSDGPKILAACAPGEQHEIGLLLFALAAHDAGFRVVLLGANVPFREAAAAARRAHCDAVVISNAIERSSPEFYAELAGLVAAGRRVYVGGSAVLAREKEVAAAGAVPLTTSIESAVRRLAAEIGGAADRAVPGRAGASPRRRSSRPRRA
jgi:DNA-binding transcriptional MerR regulator/methylmalonyl-CoA mutase cobalamin-binding subunit